MLSSVAEELRLEAAHLARRRRPLGDGMTADDPAHGRIVPKAVSIVHVFVAAEPSEDGLTEQPGHSVLTVLPGSRVDKALSGEIAHSERIVKFPEGQKTRIGGDLRTVEFQLQPTVEIQP